MKHLQKWNGILAGLCLAMLVLALAGCGSSSNTPAPAALTGVTAGAGDQQATVTWTPVSNATSYNIYYSTSASVSTSTGSKVVNATTPYNVTGLTNGTTYHFVVTAVNAGGESTVSNEVSATPEPPAPAALAGVTATAGNLQVAVNWATVSNATGYNIYYSTTPNVTTAAVDKVLNVAGPSTVTGLLNGTTYYFVVTAINGGGESPVSNEVSAMPVPAVPAKPTGLSLSGGDTQVTVSWTNDSAATSYNIYYSTSSTFTTTSNGVNKITGAANGQAVTGLTNGTAYYFAVTAQNLGGESQLSTIKTATPATQVQIPTNPSALNASAGVGQATITWGSVANATSYTIYYLQAPASPLISGTTVKATNNAITNATSPSVVTGLTSGLNYWFVVTASNSAGEGAPQNNPKAALIQ
ncbi:hypothetical protein GMLC_26190 [Geomonas limicola]|uniref:Fibronectin type-III domain-containing protein n=1 Tax=Geomonas limicola TaxID=2740186 RepID=A0A6V8N9D1_9BACT|nr:fibronectin type III domain-containing protein [Geomonas limicola]GFO69040.1 hypothetical protein GMLC_26190 [Geomonas limicola]